MKTQSEFNFGKTELGLTGLIYPIGFSGFIRSSYIVLNSTSSTFFFGLMSMLNLSEMYWIVFVIRKEITAETKAVLITDKVIKNGVGASAPTEKNIKKKANTKKIILYSILCLRDNEMSSFCIKKFLLGSFFNCLKWLNICQFQRETYCV